MSPLNLYFGVYLMMLAHSRQEKLGEFYLASSEMWIVIGMYAVALTLFALGKQSQAVTQEQPR
jgi:hypothetical protein